MTTERKTLEIFINGKLKETVSLDVGCPIKVTEIKTNDRRILNSQLLKSEQLYSFGFEDYKKVVKNNLEKLYPDKKIEIREK